MRQKQEAKPGSAEKTVRDIRRATRRRHSSEEKIRIVLEGLRGEDSIAELCRREGLNQNVYYRWSREFLEAGKKRLAGDTARDATSDEVDLTGLFWTKLCEKLSLERSFGYAEEAVQRGADRGDTPSDRSFDVAG